MSNKGGGKWAEDVARFGVQLGRKTEQQTGGIRTLGFQQGEELLRTGGVGATIPAVTRALEASKSAGATNERALQDQLATAGLAGTPYAIRAVAEQRTAQGLGQAQVEQNVAERQAALIAGMTGLLPATVAPFFGGSSAAATGLANLAAQGQQATGQGAGAAAGGVLGIIAAII